MGMVFAGRLSASVPGIGIERPAAIAPAPVPANGNHAGLEAHTAGGRPRFAGRRCSAIATPANAPRSDRAWSCGTGRSSRPRWPRPRAGGRSPPMPAKATPPDVDAPVPCTSRSRGNVASMLKADHGDRIDSALAVRIEPSIDRLRRALAIGGAEDLVHALAYCTSQSSVFTIRSDRPEPHGGKGKTPSGPQLDLASAPILPPEIDRFGRTGKAQHSWAFLCSGAPFSFHPTVDVQPEGRRSEPNLGRLSMSQPRHTNQCSTGGTATRGRSGDGYRGGDSAEAAAVRDGDPGGVGSARAHPDGVANAARALGRRAGSCEARVRRRRAGDCGIRAGVDGGGARRRR